jgi:hypothetical protein
MSARKEQMAADRKANQKARLAPRHAAQIERRADDRVERGFRHLRELLARATRAARQRAA